MRAFLRACARQGSQTLTTGALALANSYAFNPAVTGFPTGDFSVEMWARTPAHGVQGGANAFMSLLSYATHTQQGAACARAWPPPSCRVCPLASSLGFIFILQLLHHGAAKFPGCCVMYAAHGER